MFEINYKQLLAIAGSILVILGLTPIALALAFVPARVINSHPEVTVVVPDVAVERAFGLEPGSLQKTIFIHPAKGGVKGPPGGGGKGEDQCFKLMRSQWKSTPVSYVIHPDLEAADPGALSTAAETWDTSTSLEIFDNAVTFDSTATWDSDAPDGRNEMVFGNYPQAGVLAVTVVWSGIKLGGGGRQIIEFDILFDTDFAWGDATVNSAVFDLENVGAHEIGHGIGLDHPSDSCTEETMYRFASAGETKKRDLNAGDIAGLQKMYGA